MIGEIRDLETAEIALKASQTGHLVLSTLHTNDSISALPRLLDLGIPEYLIAASLTGILAQRLVRKLCQCHTYEPPTPAYIERLAAAGWAEVPDKIATPAGCPVCVHTGYKGRIGIYELLVMDDSIRSVLRTGFRADLIRNAARASGMRRMQEDAFEKLHLGVTTLEEVARVVPIEAMAPTECLSCGHELLPAFHYCPFCGVPRESEALTSQSNAARRVSDGVLLP
jgi:type II secretory ATPase GspE/PulE/Tfp pilus assembly ATPase PilB-like protein